MAVTIAARGAAKASPDVSVAALAGSLATAINTDVSRVIAQGRIAITARYLNIDGLEQSGVQTVTLHVGATFRGTATGSSLLDATGRPLAGISFGADGVAGGQGKDADLGSWQ